MAKQPITNQLLWLSETKAVTIAYIFQNWKGDAMDMYIQDKSWATSNDEWLHYELRPYTNPNLWWDCDDIRYVGKEA